MPMVSMAPVKQDLTDEEIQAEDQARPLNWGRKRRRKEFSCGLLGNPKCAVLSCTSSKFLSIP